MNNLIVGKRLQKDPTNTFLRHTYSIHVKQYNRLKKSLKSAFYKTFIDKINTLDHARRIFVIPAHCHLLDFESYAPCNDVIFSQSMRGFHFLSFECHDN
jgi:hypothetical protein